MSASPRKRVVFVGIDGATWRIIEPMIAAGKLPNLRAMMEHGSYGPLRSTSPPNSSLAWSSFQTGVEPGKHGIFFFREQRPGSYERPVVSFHSIQAPTVWELASGHGRKVVLAYVPMTFPPPKINGAVVGGLLTPDRHADFIHPPELRADLERELGFPVPSDNEPELLFHNADQARALKRLIEVTEQVEKVGMALLEREDPDLFALVFRGVDLASHQAWCFQDPEWVARNPTASRGRERILADMYQRVDAALGRFRDKALALDGEVAFGCCSDHGFGPISYRFYLNKWLVDHGYLVLKKGAGRSGRLKLYLQRKWRGFLRRSGIARRRSRHGGGFGPSPEQLIRDMVDWSRSRAWSSFSGGEDVVLINLAGREPEGIVQPGAEYEALREEIIARLLEVRAPDGTPVVDRACKREELWHGPQLASAPDIQFLTYQCSVNCAANPLHPQVVEEAVEGRPAMHRQHGVYLWEGPGIRAGHRQEGHGIADMGVTMLHFLGLPVEDSMDGKVMEDILEPEALAAEPVQLREGHVQLAPRRYEGAGAADDERLMETMRALGYME